MSLTEISLMWMTGGLALVALGGGGARLIRLSPGDRRWVWSVGFVMGLWLVSTGVVASPRVVPPSILLVLLLALSPLGGRLAQALSFEALVGFQMFRVPVELILYGFFLEHKIPERMTFAGSNLDIVTGATAFVLLVLLRRGRAGRGVLWAWNLMGFCLLLNILTIALISIPANTLPFHWPDIWILFCVMMALLVHLLTFRKLVRRAGSQPVMLSP